MDFHEHFAGCHRLSDGVMAFGGLRVRFSDVLDSGNTCHPKPHRLCNSCEVKYSWVYDILKPLGFLGAMYSAGASIFRAALPIQGNSLHRS